MHFSPRPSYQLPKSRSQFAGSQRGFGPIAFQIHLPQPRKTGAAYSEVQTEFASSILPAPASQSCAWHLFATCASQSPGNPGFSRIRHCLPNSRSPYLGVAKSLKVSSSIRRNFRFGGDDWWRLERLKASSDEVRAAIRAKSTELGRALVAEWMGFPLTDLTPAEEDRTRRQRIRRHRKAPGKPRDKDVQPTQEPGFDRRREVSVMKSKPT